MLNRYEPTGARSHGAPDWQDQYEAEHGTMDEQRNGPRMLLGVMIAGVLTVLMFVLAAPMIADAWPDQRPAVCDDFSAECAAAVEEAM